MFATKMTVRTLATLGAMATITACGAVSPTPEIAGEPGTAEETATEDPTGEESEEAFGPPWDRLPEADRPRHETHRTHLGCVLVNDMAPC